MREVLKTLGMLLVWVIGVLIISAVFMLGWHLIYDLDSLLR